MYILCCLPVISESPHFVCKSLIISSNSTCIAISTEIFPWVKTICRNISKSANHLPVILCKMGLCGVFDYFYSVFFCNLHNGFHISTLPVKVNSNNCFCVFCDFSFEFICINQVIFIIVNKNWSCSALGNSFRS